MSQVSKQAAMRMAVVKDCAAGREDGQSMSEYAVVMAGVALMVIVSLYVVGDRIGTLISNTAKLIG
jgi:Flp pilus assembly pilin Flp